MRKLLPVPVIACLLALAPALAAPDDASVATIPSLIAIEELHSAKSTADASENTQPLISSSVAGDPLDAHEASTRLRAAALEARRDAAQQSEQPQAPAASVPPHLEAIAACESGGDPSAIGGGGAYRGKYQFSVATWQAVGGSGDPAAAPEAEQDRRAAMLYAQSGPSQWPNCAG